MIKGQMWSCTCNSVFWFHKFGKKCNYFISYLGVTWKPNLIGSSYLSPVTPQRNTENVINNAVYGQRYVHPRPSHPRVFLSQNTELCITVCSMNTEPLTSTPRTHLWDELELPRHPKHQRLTSLNALTAEWTKIHTKSIRKVEINLERNVQPGKVRCFVWPCVSFCSCKWFVSDLLTKLHRNRQEHNEHHSQRRRNRVHTGWTLGAYAADDTRKMKEPKAMKLYKLYKYSGGPASLCWAWCKNLAMLLELNHIHVTRLDYC